MNSTIQKPFRTKVYSGQETITGTTGQWARVAITFPAPFKSIPLVTVSHLDTSEGTFWGMPMIQSITTTGFEYGWYGVSGTHKTRWQAIGEA